MANNEPAFLSSKLTILINHWDDDEQSVMQTIGIGIGTMKLNG